MIKLTTRVDFPCDRSGIQALVVVFDENDKYWSKENDGDDASKYLPYPPPIGEVFNGVFWMIVEGCVVVIIRIHIGNCKYSKCSVDDAYIYGIDGKAK